MQRWGRALFIATSSRSRNSKSTHATTNTRRLSALSQRLAKRLHASPVPRLPTTEKDGSVPGAERTHTPDTRTDLITNDEPATLVEILSKHVGEWTVSIQNTLWRIVLVHGDTLDTSQRLAVVIAISQLVRYERPVGASTDDPNLAQALANVVFAPDDKPVCPWALSQARLAFCVGDAAAQWTNLTLLASFQSPEPRVTPESVPPSDWGLAFSLVALGKSPDISRVCSLWAAWSAVPSERPVYITRTIVAAFISLASDAESILDIHRYASVAGAFRYTTPTEQKTVLDFTVKWVVAAVSCQVDWDSIFTNVKMVVPGMFKDVAHATFKALDLRSPPISLLKLQKAHQLYELCESAGISVPDYTVTHLASVLVEAGVVDPAIAMLGNERLASTPVRQALVMRRIMESLALRDNPRIPPHLAGILGHTIVKLSQPSLRHMPTSPTVIERVAHIVALSGHPRPAVEVILSVHRHDKSFLSMEFFEAFLRMLSHQGQHRFSIWVLHAITRSHPTAVTFPHRRMVLIEQAEAGNPRNARGVYGMMLHCGDELDMRVNMMKAINFRLEKPTESAFGPLSLSTLIKRKETSLTRPEVELAMAIFIRSHRITAARQLLTSFLAESRARGTPPATELFNIFLGSAEIQSRRRRGQWVKLLLFHWRRLVEEHAFEPDRVSFNILMDATLASRSLDAKGARGLFDLLVVHGFFWTLSHRVVASVPPIPSAPSDADTIPSSPDATEPTTTTQLADLPFGTQASFPDAAAIFFIPSNLPVIRSFPRHTEPLLKMFISCFHSMKDGVAAKRVIGIMREEEVYALREKADVRAWIERQRMKKRGKVEVEEPESGVGMLEDEDVIGDKREGGVVDEGDERL